MPANTRPAVTRPSNPIIRPRDAAAYLGIGRSTLYRLIESGALPRPIRLSSQVTGWRMSTLESFIAKHEVEVAS